MKSAIPLLALLSQLSLAQKADFRKNVATHKVGENVKVDGNKISWKATGDEDSDTINLVTLLCKAPKHVTLSEDRKYFACCSEGQRLFGSPETAFDCCAGGHDLIGSAEVGYQCCPDGWGFDGTLCTEPPSCPNGQVFCEDGQCQCPPGQTMGPEGVCEEAKQTTGKKCDSGLTTGQCYNFIIPHLDKPLGISKGGNLVATSGSMHTRPSKFQLCKDKACTPGHPVDPNDTLFIRDLYGEPPTGANTGKWIGNMPNGDHMQLTADFSKAGKLP
ncbi:hypothetical protein BDW74DRAFT_173677 [Aspergillus multicolor]|uniref:uncharacterized protein n=1 Tax=Aspergillus multicolor TaxID=41759 RepID=UPI003CCCE74A